MNKISSKTWRRRPGSARLLVRSQSLSAGQIDPAEQPYIFSRRPVGVLRTQLAGHRRRLEAAGRIGRMLSDCLTLSELYERLADKVFALLPGSSHLYVFRTEDDSQGINFIHAVQNCKLSGKDNGVEMIPPPAPAGLLTQVAHGQRPLIINDLKNFRRAGWGNGQRALGSEVRSVLLVPMVARCRVKGVLELLSQTHLFTGLDADLLSLIANTTAMAIENRHLSDELTIASRGLSAATENAIEGYRRALELRDRVTEGHSIRVAELAVQLAGSLGFDPPALIFVRFGAMLHDIGKIGVPDRVLLKAGPLDADDRLVMRKHPEYALEMLSSIPNITPVLEIPYYHHEKWDGSGYPRGLKGEAIPLPARIFAVIDVYDALCSERPYRTAWNEDEAVSYIRTQSGRHFDPQVVEAFLGLMLTRHLATPV